MAVVVRLKRYLDEEPLDNLVINCKRRKIDGSSKDGEAELSKVLEFAGTAKDQNENIFTHLKKPSKSQIEQQFKKHQTDVTSTLRQQMKDRSEKSRYKIVNQFRFQDVETTADSNGSEVMVYDIETENHEDIEDYADKEVQQRDFVFDLYYTASDDLGEANMDYVSLFSLDTDVLYGPEDPDETNYLSDDSNDEWQTKNEYPDESEVESEDEEGMVEAMQKVNLEFDEGSSEDEDFTYDRDNEVEDYDDILTKTGFGTRFAKFRAKYQNAQANSSNSCYFREDSDEEDYY